MVSEMTTFNMQGKHNVQKALQDLKILTGEQWTITRLINTSIAFYLKEAHGIDLEDY
jgi:hypothetical protein